MKTIFLISVFFLSGMIFNEGIAQEKSKEKVSQKVEEMPVYQGGDKALSEFIVKNVKYPENAKKEGKTGKVFVSFVVDKKGKVKDARVVKGVCPELDSEALRVINLLENWTPGKNKGKPVKVTYTLPIQFALS